MIQANSAFLLQALICPPLLLERMERLQSATFDGNHLNSLQLGEVRTGDTNPILTIWLIDYNSIGESALHQTQSPFQALLFPICD